MAGFRPNLAINYSQDFSLAIRFSRVQRYAAVCSEYYFDFTCRILHSKGEFVYTGRDICFAPQTFREFAEQLNAIRQGKAERAEFHEIGDMIDFAIEIRGRETRASVRIREYQPNGEQSLLTASFRVDYDLFVNALYRMASEFSMELASVERA